MSTRNADNSTASGTPILVKIARLGSRAVEVALSDGATVQDALTSGGFTVGSREQARLNGAQVNTSTRVFDGDLVTIVQATIKGGKRARRTV